MEDLAALFEKCRRQEQAFAEKYPELAVQPPSAARTAGPVARTAARPPRRAPAAPPKAADSPDGGETAPRAPDAEDLQFYRLRRRYGRQSPEPRYEAACAAAQPAPAWADREPEEMSAGELQLYLQTELTGSQPGDKALRGLALQSAGRGRAGAGADPFLSVYTAAECSASRKELERIGREMPQRPNSEYPESFRLYAAGCIARYTLLVAEYADKLQEQGYRNRQKALDEAVAAAQRKYDAAHQDTLNTPRDL